MKRLILFYAAIIASAGMAKGLENINLIQGGSYRIYGGIVNYKFTVYGGTASDPIRIELDGITINSDDYAIRLICPQQYGNCTGQTFVELTVIGVNFLNGDPNGKNAILEVPERTTLTIKGTGTLNVGRGYQGAASIGGHKGMFGAKGNNYDGERDGGKGGKAYEGCSMGRVIIEGSVTVNVAGRVGGGDGGDGGDGGNAEHHKYKGGKGGNGGIGGGGGTLIINSGTLNVSDRIGSGNGGNGGNGGLPRKKGNENEKSCANGGDGGDGGPGGNGSWTSPSGTSLNLSDNIIVNGGILNADTIGCGHGGYGGNGGEGGSGGSRSGRNGGNGGSGGSGGNSGDCPSESRTSSRTNFSIYGGTVKIKYYYGGGKGGRGGNGGNGGNRDGGPINHCGSGGKGGAAGNIGNYGVLSVFGGNVTILNIKGYTEKYGGQGGTKGGGCCSDGGCNDGESVQNSVSAPCKLSVLINGGNVKLPENGDYRPPFNSVVTWTEDFSCSLNIISLGRAYANSPVKPTAVIDNRPVTTGPGTRDAYGVKDVKADENGDLYFWLRNSWGEN